jgi:capsular polysaccharide transport system permease protein
MPATENPPFPPPLQPRRAANRRLGVRTRSYPTLRTVLALILREMSTRYGQSPGGYLWAVLEPLGAILILALGLSLLIRHPSLGTSFILFYATGFMPFSVYQSIQNTVSRALNFSRPLLMYPSVTWLDALIARAALNILTGVMVSYLLLAGIVLVDRTSAVIDIGPVILAMVMTALLGVGVGAFNCLLIGMFPAWEIIWSIISRPLFLASGILFLFEDLPRSIQTFLWYNPLLHIVGEMRRGFYPMYSPQYVSPAYVILLSLGLLAFSLVLLQRYHADILDQT